MSADKYRYPPPRCTYRIQLNPDFTLYDAAQHLAYFEALGVSHLYTSPFLKARAGSSHGYDVTDHNAFNPEVGGSDGFEVLAAGLAERGMGQLLDFVPNHMGIGMADNQWWLDVLEWGEASPYANHFDIDWQSATAPLRGKVLVPFLGEPYGKVLEEGQLTLGFEAQSGSFAVHYYEHLFPIAPRHYAGILERALSIEPNTESAGPLADLIPEFRNLRARGVSRRRQGEIRQRAAALKARLAALVSEHEQLGQTIEAALSHFNGTAGKPDTFIVLHRLLERQSYRLAFWRVAADEINYRRFFDINDLAGIRVEREDVFNDTHQLVLRLLDEGKLQGLRIDHIDGLYDPHHYCERLQRAAGTPEGQPIYLLVEKILAAHEQPRQDWPISGTTGYEMLNRINALFVAGAAAGPLYRFYRRFTGCGDSFEEVLIEAKRLVIDHLLASEMQVLANRFSRLAETNWRTRDFTLPAMRAALTEIVVYFPVYRTYATALGANAVDRRDLDWAVRRAQRSDPLIDADLFLFIKGVLSTDLARPHSGYNRNEVVRLAMKFQQYTGPVMAKSMEDTAFYRYLPLVSLNEVGGEPTHFGTSASAFHQYVADRAKRWPYALVSTATHDSKRGEDVRARLNVLSEIPDTWARQVRSWAQANRRWRTAVGDAVAPGRNDEYLLYQTLVGTWPPLWREYNMPSPEALRTYRERIEAYMIKAVREAKLYSSWSHPDERYEQGLSAFINAVLQTETAPFLRELSAFVETISPAAAVNGLAQTVLKLTLPGVPDLYQGGELWDFNLVDPDNRGPVDFAAREAMLQELQQRSKTNTATLVEHLRNHWRDGQLKLYLIWRLLGLRRNKPALFSDGGYEPLSVIGRYADRICAFRRTWADAQLLSIVPCGVADINAGQFPLGEPWGDTAVVLSDPPPKNASDIFSGLSPAGLVDGQLPLANVFSVLPVAVIVSS